MSATGSARRTVAQGFSPAKTTMSGGWRADYSAPACRSADAEAARRGIDEPLATNNRPRVTQRTTQKPQNTQKTCRGVFREFSAFSVDRRQFAVTQVNSWS